MDAYLATFKVYVIAHSKPEALSRLKVWRALAVGCGLAPGAGTVTSIPAGELPASVLSELNAARAKIHGPASPALRERAVASLASHFDGDLTFAEELASSIERRSGQLPAALANALADGQAVTT